MYVQVGQSTELRYCSHSAAKPSFTCGRGPSWLNSGAPNEHRARVLALYLDGRSYEEIGGRIGCDTKTVDNALQRVKRKVGIHLASRAVKI